MLVAFYFSFNSGAHFCAALAYPPSDVEVLDFFVHNARARSTSVVEAHYVHFFARLFKAVRLDVENLISSKEITGYPTLVQEWRDLIGQKKHRGKLYHSVTQIQSAVSLIPP